MKTKLELKAKIKVIQEDVDLLKELKKVTSKGADMSLLLMSLNSAIKQIEILNWVLK